MGEDEDKPRTLEEVAGEMAKALERYLEEHATAHHNTVTELLKGYENIRSGE